MQIRPFPGVLTTILSFEPIYSQSSSLLLANSQTSSLYNSLSTELLKRNRSEEEINALKNSQVGQFTISCLCSEQRKETFHAFFFGYSLVVSSGGKVLKC